MNAHRPIIDHIERVAARRAARAPARWRRRPWRWLRPAAVVAAAGLAAAALVPVTALASPAQPAVPVLAWRSCYGDFQCASARVPLGYRNPRSATVSIAVIRHLATGPARRLGSLFFNGGGPNPQVQSFATGFGGENAKPFPATTG